MEQPSKLGGGKFANGAVSGAFVHMYNYQEHLPKWMPESGNKAEQEYTSLKVINSVTRFFLYAGDVIGEAVSGGYHGLNRLLNLDLQQHPEASPFILMLKTSRFTNDFALGGKNKILNVAKQFNPTSIHNSADGVVKTYNTVTSQ